MEYFKLFLDLTRLQKPIGFMLLFWPCAWGLTIGFEFSTNNFLYFKYLILFFIGSVLMRSAGCIVNDIFDKDIDITVKRTKNRPIASGKISVKNSLLITLILCLLAFLILIQFNSTTIFLGLASMPFAFTYPLMKRYTYWPQLFLGFTFNYGLIMAWFSLDNEFSIAPIIFYFGAIFWTLAYDTIYGFQDIKDDEIIGVKSTSIKFKKNPKIFLSICYSITFLTILITGLIMYFNIVFFFGLILIAYLLYYQVKNFEQTNPYICLKIFKLNNLFGIAVFLNILIGKF